MPAFLVALKDSVPGLPSYDGNAKLVFAKDATDARALADGDNGSDVAGLYQLTDAADATELVVGADLSGYSLRVKVLDASPVIDITANGVLGLNTDHETAAGEIVVEAGGTGYAVDDIITLSDGATNVSTRAATFRVITAGGGVVSVVEIVDPGHYTTLTDDGSGTPLATTGGTGSGCTLSFGAGFATAVSYGNLFADAVGQLNALAAVSNAAIDMSDGASGARLFTVTGAADNLGDRILNVTVEKNGVAIPSYVGTITDQGAAGAALTAALETKAGLTYPNVQDTLKQVR